MIPLLLIGAALAQESTSEAAAEVEEPEKQWRWAGLPIGNYSSTYGVGYGAYANLVNSGEHGSGEDPYKARIAVQLYFTTGSYQDHFLQLDFPGLLGTRFRWDLQAGYTRWDTATYFGNGNNLPRFPAPLDADGNAVSCSADTFDQGAGADGALPPCFYNYGNDGFKVNTNLRRELGGAWSLFSNLYVRQFEIEVYPDSLVEVTQPYGVDGGLYSRLGLGIMHDTRDQEPSPTSGEWSELSVRTSRLWDGQDHAPVWGINVTDRWWTSAGRHRRLVFANQVIVDMRWGDEPFFMRHAMGGSQEVNLGTSMALRGFPSSRFQGDGTVLWMPEVRWNYATAHLGGNALQFTTGPYFDLGRVWLWRDNPDYQVDDPVTHFHYAGGLANRFIWNTNMVVRLDFGFGREEIVQDTLPLDADAVEDVSYEPNFSLFLVFDHPY